MCVLVTKKDEHGNPVWAKSRIVVLGNKDPQQWTKGNCFAPVATHVRVVLVAVLSTVPYGSLTPSTNVFSKEHILILPVLRGVSDIDGIFL
jgi:hypothetical protein